MQTVSWRKPSCFKHPLLPGHICLSLLCVSNLLSAHLGAQHDEIKQGYKEEEGSLSFSVAYLLLTWPESLNIRKRRG